MNEVLGKRNFRHLLKNFGVFRQIIEMPNIEIHIEFSLLYYLMPSYHSKLRLKFSFEYHGYHTLRPAKSMHKKISLILFTEFYIRFLQKFPQQANILYLFLIIFGGVTLGVHLFGIF